ncbi:MFS transporter [Heyndrickxia camelliae]|uniref:MFS transporter n=1 Tax=Heyndrickxia camelliae TaxID=1707093 RepID=A0A2N3LEV4_9BACI|nr:MFS transporter [Heyndrickxia camelliae]PKR83158.1 MFS transporter [Heyndrickxia camelliae]
MSFKSTVSGQIHSGARRLMLVNALRSVGQGMMVVDLALYLDALGWSTAAIGGVLATSGLLAIGLAPCIGIYSDRIGRKPFILFYELLIAACALTGVLTTNFIWLFIAISLSGFGKADAGSPSPCAPAEQAWLSTFIPAAERGKVYSLNNALSFFGMATGAVLGGTTAFWGNTLPGELSFRSIFFFVFVLSLITSSIIVTVKSVKPVKVVSEKEEMAECQDKNIHSEENKAVFKLAAINILNGLAVGLTGPMMSYWLSEKFGASSTQIGGTLAVTFFATGITSVIQARLSQKHGNIRSIVLVRFLASTLLILIPLLPNFGLVSLAYVIRTALNRGTQGAQQALSVSLTRDNRRGFASSVNVLSMRIPSSIGPYISGYLFGLGSLSLPFYIAAGLQYSFAYFYGKIFSSYDVRMRTHASSG